MFPAIRRRGATLAAAALLLGPSALAQTTASLFGRVTAGGVPLAGVTVALSSPALQGTRATVTGGAGGYELASLPPGAYRIAFSRDGFSTAHRETILPLAHRAKVDAELQPEGSGTITVSADAPAVLDTPQVATSLPLAWVDRLPLQRNQLATAQLAPGVTANTFSNGQLQISGGPGYDNLVLVNGVVVTENTRGQMRPMYVEDAIQETTLLTGAISAEYGRFSGGVVNTLTKSGGNELSGSLRDSLGSPAWSAQSPARETRESTLNHVWEATLGGYVLRDRLWFFSSARWAKNDTARQTVPVPPFGNPASAASPAVSYAEGNDQKRWEGKLTALLGARQTLVASYFGIQTDGTNVRFNANFYDLASLTTRDDPETLAALHYDGVLAPNWLVEGHASRRRFSDRSGATTTDPIGGTLLLDRSNSNTRFHAPSLCGVCDADRRDNEDLQLELHAFLGDARRGTHSIVAGVDRFREERYANGHQSGSGFSLFVTRAQYANGTIYPVITPTNANGGGTFIRWTPVLTPGRANDLETDAAFVNDVWSPSPRWQLSLGVRWDRNHAVDGDGTLVSDDSKWSPRLSAQYDLRGNGRQRVSASFSDYASRIADGVASLNQASGNAAAIDFAYRGPAINDRQLNTSPDDVIRQVLDYFHGMQGGTANRNANNLRANGSRTIPGYTAYFDGALASPFVREMTLGYGAELGAHGYLRADLIHRDWRDFYAASITADTRRANTPLGIPVDLALIRNSEAIERHYRGLQLQARWSPGKLDTGVHYTLSSLRGNDEGENANGAAAAPDPSLYYPEFFDYERAAPTGPLSGDERHRVRAWIGYETTLGLARLGLTALHNYGSGLPYSIAAPIHLTRYSGAPANPGYNSIPNGSYFFSGRGALRADAIHSTDLALRTAVRWGRFEWFAQGDVLNVFNRDGIADPARLGASITTAATSATFHPFNPATDTPIECPRNAAAAACTAMGAHYQLAPNFGEPLNNLAYQTPRTWRISLGARF